MRTMFTRFTMDDAKPFIKTRDLIGKFFFVLFLFVYGAGWVAFKSTSDMPEFSYYLTFALLPIALFGLHMRMYHYFFLHNWFYALYCAATGTLFFMIISYFHPSYKETGYVWFELGHLLASNLIGLIVAIGLSLPFKIAHWFLFEPSKFYFEDDRLKKIDDRIYPDKMEKKLAKEKQKFLFDTLNETQLQAELSAALREDRFEDAGKIKELLEKKFKV